MQTYDRIEADLAERWEVLAEAVQTVMRRHGVTDAYERLKEVTRGQQITRAALVEFIQTQPIPEAERARLLALTPATYTGLAAVSGAAGLICPPASCSSAAQNVISSTAVSCTVK